ncbi:MAG: CPBP family intramembrane metalloprotease [Actinobacteria bacterium]|nr:CPBP family intramembrane metalloprotease [Actinomycetota bacterium]
MSSVPPDPSEPQGGGAPSRPPLPAPTGPGLPPGGRLPLAHQEGASEVTVAENGARPRSGEDSHQEDEAPRWAWWQALLGLAAALVGTAVIGGVVVGTVALATGVPLRSQPPLLNILGVIVQDFVFIGAALAFAAVTARPRAWHFGLRRASFWSTLGWAALGVFSYLVFNVTYQALVEPQAEQGVAEALGVNDSAALLVIGGFVIIVMAPIAEEVFFRGFFYRAVRNSLARPLGRWRGAVLGAVVTGLLFGAIHIEPGNVAKTLPIIPVLATLGVMFCLVYERTGSLFSVIALHALVNATAYLAVAKNSAPVALGLGGAMVTACIVLPRFLSRGPAPAAA